jgi:hypothetical protein
MHYLQYPENSHVADRILMRAIAMKEQQSHEVSKQDNSQETSIDDNHSDND